MDWIFAHVVLLYFFLCRCDDGHGPLFKAWGKRCMRVFPVVEVSTLHSYNIQLKYQFQCSNA